MQLKGISQIMPFSIDKTSSPLPHANWWGEKTEEMMIALAAIADILSCGIDPTFCTKKEALTGRLLEAIDMGLRLLYFGTDISFEGGESRGLVSDGKRGFDRLCERFDLHLNASLTPGEREQHFPSITHSRHPEDMGPWVRHNSLLLLQLLSRLCDAIPEIAATSPTEDSGEVLSKVLDVAVPFYAFGNDAVYEPTDARTVFRFGNRGLEQLNVKYVLIEKTSGQRLLQKQESAIANIYTLLQGPRAPSRTLIYEQLLSKWLNEDLRKKLLDLNDAIRMGEMGWDEYRELNHHAIRHAAKLSDCVIHLSKSED